MSDESRQSKPQTKPNPASERAELVVVYTSMGPLGAEVVKGRLESAGIPAMLKYESAGPVLGVIIDGLGQVQVLVSKGRAQEARGLLSETE